MTTSHDGPVAPASFPQRRRVLSAGEEQAGWTPPTKTVPILGELPADIDIDLLAAVTDDFTRRHPVLRHRFVRLGGDVGLRRVVDDRCGVRFEVVKDDGVSAGAADQAVRELVDRSFDVLDWPLLRAAVLVGERPRLCVVADHAVSDGHSLLLALREIEQLYVARRRGRSAGLPPAGDYLGHSARQRLRFADGAELDRQVTGLLALLGGRPIEPLFPVDTGGWHREPGRYADLELLDRAGAARLDRLCRENRATPFMAVLAAFGIALRESVGDAEAGVLVATHNRENADDLSGVGWYANMLPIYFRAGEAGDFPAALREIRASIFRLLPYHELPLSRVRERASFDGSEGFGAQAEIRPTCFMSYVDLRPPAGSLRPTWPQFDLAPAYRIGYGVWLFRRDHGLRAVIASPAPRDSSPLDRFEQRFGDALREAVR